MTNDSTRNRDGNNNNGKIKVTVNNTSDLFDLMDLKRIWYFKTLWSQKWNNNSSKIKNTITIDGITTWNIMHLKYLIKCMKIEKNQTKFDNNNNKIDNYNEMRIKTCNIGDTISIDSNSKYLILKECMKNENNYFCDKFTG